MDIRDREYWCWCFGYICAISGGAEAGPVTTSPDKHAAEIAAYPEPRVKATTKNQTLAISSE